MMNMELRFDGVDYKPERDGKRLAAQFFRIWDYMAKVNPQTGATDWHTLKEISEATGAPEPSASACLRDFRKERNGGHTVLRTYINNGIYKYKLVVKQ